MAIEQVLAEQRARVGSAGELFVYGEFSPPARS
jgi:hypothetical protein